MRQGQYAKPSPVTVEEALNAYIVGMKSGTILDRAGRRYKPSTCRSYEHAARVRLIPLIGA